MQPIRTDTVGDLLDQIASDLKAFQPGPDDPDREHKLVALNLARVAIQQQAAWWRARAVAAAPQRPTKPYPFTAWVPKRMELS